MRSKPWAAARTVLAIGLAADLLVIEHGEHRYGRTGFGDGRQECPQPGVAGALVVQSRCADQIQVAADQLGRHQIMGHEFPAQHRTGFDAGAFGDEGQERARFPADPPHRVHMPLRVQGHPAPILGEMDGQLRYPQDRFVDANQSLPHHISVAYREPSGDAEVAVQPRVEPGPAVGLQPDHLPARHRGVGMLFDPQIRAVGMRADDSERGGLPGAESGGRTRSAVGPGDQGAAAHHVVAARAIGGPGRGLRQPGETVVVEFGGDGAADVERRG